MTVITCVCPPKADGTPRHPDGDTVTLREALGFRGAATARNSIAVIKTEDPDVSVAEILAVLTESYLLVGIESWTLVDDKGKPVEVSSVTIRSFFNDHPEEALLVGDDADALYNEVVMRPLLRMASAASQPTPIARPTSVKTGSRRPRPSRPSSTSTSQTDGTEKMSASPGGAYS